MLNRLTLVFVAVAFSVSALAQIPKPDRVKKSAPVPAATPVPVAKPIGQAAPQAAPAPTQENGQSVSQAVKAEGFDSEYFHQPSEQEFEILLAAQFGFGSNYRLKNGTKDLNRTFEGVAPLGLSLRYGITNSIAAGLDLSYFSLRVKGPGTTDFRVDGLSEPALVFAGLIDAEFLNVSYGARVGIPLEKGRVSDNGKERNASNGELSFTPNVGVEAHLGMFVFGSQLLYQIRGERKQEQLGVESKTTGGNNLNFTAFGEVLLFGAHFGVSATQSWVSETEDSGVKFSGYNQSSARTYASYPVGPVDLLAALNLIFFDSSYEKFNSSFAIVGARLNF
jgi:hypothetical protein